MQGKDVRMGRLFSNGHPVIVAADHGSYMGPLPGIESLPRQAAQFKKADAFLVMPGMAKRCTDFFAHKDAPLCIVRVNWASHYCTPYLKESSKTKRDRYYDRGCSERLCSVEYAVSLGADVVIASLLLGTDEQANTRNIKQFGEVVSEADFLGVPVIGEYIPFGGIDRYSGDVGDLLLGVRACAEFGADVIKTVFVEHFEDIAGCSVVPALALGGGVFEKPSDAFRLAQKALEKGAKGIVFGRNVFCAKNPELYLDCLREVVKNGQDPQEAEKAYLDGLNQNRPESATKMKR